MESGEDGNPIAVHLPGQRCAAEAVLETWRIDDEWWRERPLSRLYFTLLLEDGRVMTVYQDPIGLRWARQVY